ncbi:hypothetical protein [Fulvivirga sediminis]|uniref:Uncharacterized protein n=1 Tax=Fulvivirga sediminis TaxID=2803949 RepID=A0A937F757_9BACT|nr:hypothetical protein [Fulvivirga sediminis]MBL3655560.1 hypothetical protein [Fulvivirga sediminis]
MPKLRQVKQKYPDNIEYEYACEDCSSSNAYLSLFDYQYKFENDSLFFYLKSGEYFRDLCYQNFCAPQLKVAYPLTSVIPLFKKDFDWEKYKDLDRISQIAWYMRSLENPVKRSILISGRIDGQYSFLMTLDLEDEDEIKGVYMYTSNGKFLELKGHGIEPRNVEVFEYLNGKSTGKFKLKYEGTLESAYDIKRFEWYSADGKKSYKVEVDAFDIY